MAQQYTWQKFRRNGEIVATKLLLHNCCECGEVPQMNERGDAWTRSTMLMKRYPTVIKLIFDIQYSLSDLNVFVSPLHPSYSPLPHTVSIFKVSPHPHSHFKHLVVMLVPNLPLPVCCLISASKTRLFHRQILCLCYSRLMSGADNWCVL